MLSRLSHCSVAADHRCDIPRRDEWWVRTRKEVPRSATKWQALAKALVHGTKWRWALLLEAKLHLLLVTIYEKVNVEAHNLQGCLIDKAER